MIYYFILRTHTLNIGPFYAERAVLTGTVAKCSHAILRIKLTLQAKLNPGGESE